MNRSVVAATYVLNGFGSLDWFCIVRPLNQKRPNKDIIKMGDSQKIISSDDGNPFP
jgi:hypothetical protein